ncbi:MAG: hypothetical protein NXI24_00740 [bacterium]|nr:hypothetical protein [bacterium]
MKGYPLDRLHEEIAFVSYHFHWSHGALMQMEHSERKRWCEEISKINRKVASSEENQNERSFEQML